MGALPLKEPPVNYQSQGAAAFKHVLVDPANSIWLASADGAPVDGTDGAGWTGKGSLAYDYTTGTLYTNTGTKASPVWSPVVGDTTADGITAHAGGGKASATHLTATINRLATVATLGDSVLLPPSYVGAQVVVINDGAANAQIFGAGTDTIDGVATGTGVTLTAAHRAIFFCVTAGAWQSLAGTKSS